MDTHNALIKFINSFGNLSYDQLATLSEENVNKSEVRYDYATISSIGSALKNIESSLENIHTGLKSKIQE